VLPPVSRVSRIDLRTELRHVARRFDDYLGRGGAGGPASSADPGIRRDNVAVVLPYFLVEAVPFEGDLRAARSMAVGNAFGAAHFLIQDRLIDGDETLSPTALELSDRFLIGFVREYGRLDPLDDGFWDDFSRYLAEYSGSLSWETEVLRTPLGIGAVSDEEIPRTLARLGHRMALLKTSGAAIARLAGRPDALTPIERFVDSFHAGYQLADDLEDLEEDLRRGRWSVVAWIIARAAGLSEPSGLAGARHAYDTAVLSGAFGSVMRLVRREYERALGAARSLGSPSLVDFMERLIGRSSWELGRFERRLRLAVGPVSVAAEAGGDADEARGGPSDGARQPGARGRTAGDGRAAGRDLLDGIHWFRVGEQGYLYDVASGLFFEADPLAMSLIGWLESGAEPVDLRVLEMDHGAERVRDGLSEIALFGGAVDSAAGSFRAVRESAHPAALSSVALHLTHRCNLACDYCYHGRDRRDAPAMSEKTAFRAVDLLLEESVGEHGVSIVFFGGEPLLCPELIERVVEYATVAAGASRRVTFHVTTNGTLLDGALASRLTEMGVRILVSIDGPESDHDRHRVFPDGRGSYRLLADRLRSLPPGTRVGARATVTPQSSHLHDIVSHLWELGCSTVHLAPVSDGDMSRGFSERLECEFEELARYELGRMLEGKRPRVGNFLEAMVSIETGRVRSLPCGAGSRYLSVGAGGTLFLCHRFAGDEVHAVGDVWRGVDRGKVRLLLERFGGPGERCATCWARWLCGGPCYYDLEAGSSLSSGPGAPRCVLRTRILELAMWLYASLPAERRARAIGAARGRPGLESVPGHDESSGAARVAAGT
jgi:uncharacterized protein